MGRPCCGTSKAGIEVLVPKASWLATLCMDRHPSCQEGDASWAHGFLLDSALCIMPLG